MKDRSDDPSHHTRTFLPRSYKWCVYERGGGGKAARKRGVNKTENETNERNKRGKKKEKKCK